MRVIAGALGGRKLRVPRGRATRPTSDRVREALFSVLGIINGWRVLDLYAGSGALAIEALSRGAARAVLIERAQPALRAIAGNLQALGLQDRATVLGGPVARLLSVAVSHGPFDLILVDPPYLEVGSGRLAALLDRCLAEHRRRWGQRGSPRPTGGSCPALRIVLEHSARDGAPQLGAACLEATRLYGDTAISLYTELGAAASPAES